MARLKRYSVLVGKTVTTLFLSDKEAQRRRPAIAAAERVLAKRPPETPTRSVSDRVPDEGAVTITREDVADIVTAAVAEAFASQAPPAPVPVAQAAPEAPAAAHPVPAAGAPAGSAVGDDAGELTPEQIEAQLEAEAAGTPAKSAPAPANKARGARGKG